MKYSLIIRPNAEAQVTEAYIWYEEKLQGLGDEFLLSIDACINAIQRNPDIYQKKYKEIRMGIAERFPFGVYYLVNLDEIIVLSILHFSRKVKISPKD